MPFHLIAYEESVDPAAAFNALTAVNDVILTTAGDDVRIAKDYETVLGAAVTVNDASLAQARLTSPSLRGRLDKYIETLVNGLVFGNPPEWSDWRDGPVTLVPDEDLNVEVLSDPAAAAVHRALVLLGSENPAPVGGEILTTRATAAISLTTGTWVNGQITLSQDLPVGEYALVGCRARGTNLVAVRFVFREGSHRPGCPAINAVGDHDFVPFRMGRLGEWGRFRSTAPPSLDALGVTDSAQVLLLDLVRI